MKPSGIALNAVARIAFRMAGKADSFRIGELSSLIMPYRAGIARTVKKDEFHLSAQLCV